jgi:hypothetical protein
MNQTYWSAPDLLNEGFPDPLCIVEKILMEGFTLFAGRPKTGKSWMALCLAIAVSAGVPALGSLGVLQGPVLYLALEDTPRRIQKRLRMLLGERPPPPALYIATAWPRGEKGAARIGKWAVSQPGAALAIVDTVEKVRAKRSEKGNAYTEDYEAISMLKERADEHALALLALTHEKKGGADDMIEAATGSMGQAGTADQSWVLRRKRGTKAGKLFVTGRDIEEVTVSLQVEENAHWAVVDVDEGHDEWESSVRGGVAAAFLVDMTDVLSDYLEQTVKPGDKLPAEGVVKAATHMTFKDQRAARGSLADLGIIKRQGRSGWVYGGPVSSNGHYPTINGH